MKEQKKPNHHDGHRRENSTGGILIHIAKFAIDSTINYSLKFKALSGRKQVYEIVQERLKDQTPSTCPDVDKKLDVKLGMEETQEEMKKLLEESNSMNRYKMSGQPKKMPDESIQGLDVPRNDRKKVFIRSRL